MSVTHIDTERMTETVGTGPDWSDAEAAHLAGCTECRVELDLLAAARRLGATQVAGFNATRVAAAVRRRLDAERIQAPVVRGGYHRMRWLAGFAAAAMILLAVYTGIPKTKTSNHSHDVAGLPAVSVLPELDGLSATELEDVLQSIPPASEALDHVEMAPLTNLDANDLERMLKSMEE